MFKRVRRAFAASWLGGAFQSSSDSLSAVPINAGANDTGEHQPDRLMAEMEESMAGSRSLGSVPLLALCGEFSAGKSSLVNLLLGCDMLPTAVLPSTRRPTFLRYAPDLRIEAVLEKGEREAVASDAIGTSAREDVSYFEIGMPSAVLREIEMLDTPGFADPFHDPARTMDMVESADICVWCTLATQAWRESERQTWLSLPPRFRTRGILVVTHIDTLAHAGEHQRVRARLQREAGDLFGDIVFLAVPDAMRARRDNGQILDPEAWRNSGGDALVAALQELAVVPLEVRGESARSEHTTDTPPDSAGFDPSDLAIATHATPAGAGQTVVPETVVPETVAFVPRESDALAASQVFLETLAATVPACLAAAWIDLAKREVLLFHGREPAMTADTGLVGDAITELFHQGNPVSGIESQSQPSHGLAGDPTQYFREIFVVTDECLGAFLRSDSRTDRALVIVSEKNIDLGMMIARARRLMKFADVMT
jgi:Dynamin family